MAPSDGAQAAKIKRHPQRSRKRLKEAPSNVREMSANMPEASETDLARVGEKLQPSKYETKSSHKKSKEGPFGKVAPKF